MNLCLVSMSHVFSRAVRAVFSRSTLRLSLPCVFLAGCVSHVPQSAISDKQEDKWPDNQLADFLSTRCDDIWNLSGHDVESNPLFWLRGIDCAQRLAPVLRELAHAPEQRLRMAEAARALALPDAAQQVADAVLEVAR